MRLIIAGSRDITDYDLIVEKLDVILSAYMPDEVVSGGARGVDSLGEQWAIAHQIPIKRFPADWRQYGKSAGYKRNVEMAAYATHLVAFWNGQSRGTKHMIDIAHERNLRVRIVRTDLERANR